jgi:hypothetical protein
MGVVCVVVMAVVRWWCVAFDPIMQEIRSRLPRAMCVFDDESY